MNLQELRAARETLRTEMTALIDTAESENRGMTDAEDTRFTELRSQSDGLQTRIARQEYTGDIARASAETELRTSNGLTPQDFPAGSAVSRSPDSPPVPEPAHRAALADLDSPVLARETRAVDWFEHRSRRNGQPQPQQQRSGFAHFGSWARALTTGPRNEYERRALEEATPSAGGHTVPEHLLAQLIDALRARSVCLRAGAQTVLLETQRTSIARLLTDPEGTWRDEGAPVTDDDPTFGKVEFVARSLAVLVKVSRELLDDSVNIDAALRAAFVGSLGNAVDRAALIGSGIEPEPTGICETDDVQEIDLSGGFLDSYDPLLDAVLAIETANADASAATAVMHPREANSLARLVDQTGQPLRRPPAIETLPVMTSTQMPITDAPGDAGRIIVGDFSQLLIGIRTSLQIEVLRERFADTLEVGFLAHLRTDIAVAQPAAFVVVKGIGIPGNAYS